MSDLKQILTLVDPTTNAQPCVGKAARLALASGAKLELFVCDVAPDLRANRYIVGELYDAAVEDRCARHEAQLETLAGPLRQQGIEVTTDVAFADALSAGFSTKIAEFEPDLVVKDTHYHGPLRRAFFSNTDWQLIRECPAPLLLTKPAQWRSVVRVAAAVDPGHVDDKPAVLDHELLATAERVALKLRGDLRAVHAFDSGSLYALAVPANPIGGMPWADPGMVESLRRVHHEEFESLLAAHPNYAGCGDFIEGSPGAALQDYAREKDVDILVLGAVARGGLDRWLIGSTAERVLDRLPCDLLIVKPSRRAASAVGAVRAA